MAREQILVQMANDIADYFVAEADVETGITGVLDHLHRYWDPRMRRKLAAHVENTGGADLSPLALAAVRRLLEANPSIRTGRP